MIGSATGLRAVDIATLEACEASGAKLGSLPIGLINGTTHLGGARPPLDPKRVVAAIRAAADPASSDDDVVRLVGLPSFPTGCEVEVDEAMLASGVEADLVVSARLSHSDGVVTISHLPPDTSPEEVEEALVRLMPRHGASAASSQEPEQRCQFDSSKTPQQRGVRRSLSS